MARGSVVKRGKHYSIVYYVGTKQRWESVGRVTRKRAEELLRKKMGEVDTGTYLDPPKITFEAFAARWLEVDAKPKKWSTYLSYKSKVKQLFIPALGEFPLDQIGVEELDRLRAKWLDAGRAPSSVRTACTVLKRLFRMAVKWKYIARNPAAELEKPTLGRRPLILLEPAQLNQLLDALQAPDVEADGYVIVLTLLFTGLRIGELMALAWDDVELGRRQLHVRRIWSANRITTPKTAGSLRGGPPATTRGSASGSAAHRDRSPGVSRQARGLLQAQGLRPADVRPRAPARGTAAAASARPPAPLRVVAHRPGSGREVHLGDDGAQQYPDDVRCVRAPVRPHAAAGLSVSGGRAP
jgi:Phage integrase family/Phage integrase, N-terminal SAM-like domain